MPPASDNVWVGDLPVGFDKAMLANIFEAYGTVVESRMLPGKDPAAKPCAMIRFGSTDMASWVVQNLNGNIPEGLQEPIIARFANAHTKGDAKGCGKGGMVVEPYPTAAGGCWGGAKGGAAKGGFVPPSPSDNVWIGDLPVGCEKQDLASIFEAYGQIVDCRMLPGRDPAAKPCAMIRFASVEMATWVVENLNGNIPQGLAEAIICRFANASKKGDGKGDASGGAWAGGKAGGFLQVMPPTQPTPWNAGKPQQQQPWSAGPQQPWSPGVAGKGMVLAPGGKGCGGKGGKGGPSFASLFESVQNAGVLGIVQVPDDCQCFVKNLPSDTTDSDLLKLCSPFGAIPPNGAKVESNPDGSCKGFGYVNFADSTAASMAVMALDGHTTADGTTIAISQKGMGNGM